MKHQLTLLQFFEELFHNLFQGCWVFYVPYLPIPSLIEAGDKKVLMNNSKFLQRY